MNKKDQEIEQKLLELESSIAKEQPHPPAILETRTELTAGEAIKAAKGDLFVFMGLTCLVTGLLMFFNHVKVGTPMLAMFGLSNQGFGLIIIPLIFGIGWLMYNSKDKRAWALLSATVAVLIFSVLSSLVMSFPALSLLGLTLMFLPFALGGVLMLKGLGGAKEVERKLKQELK